MVEFIGAFLFYLLIGYIYLCWISFKAGAGYEMAETSRFIADDDNSILAVPLLWPVLMLIHAKENIHGSLRKFITRDKLGFLNKLSPSSFRKRGEIANDPDIQAEKHLLGGGK